MPAEPAAAPLRYRILGGLAVDAVDAVDAAGGRRLDLGGPKQRAVLATLLVEPGRPVSPARMVDQVWGDDPPASAETSLQAYVSNLRRALEPGRKPREAPRTLVTQPAGYALLVDRADVDATAFEDLAAAGHDLVRRGDAAGAAATLDRALERWTGPPLPELAGEAWADELATRLVQVRAQALEDRVEAGLALGEHDVLVPRIEAAIADEPFRERLRGQLALALYRSGRQRDALVALQDARRVLVEEVGIEPGPELRRLEADILAQSPALDLVAPEPAAPATVEPVTPPAAVAPRPAVASRATGERPFVGRVGELQTLVDAYGRAAAGAGRPVVISGEPGIGKTRLVEELVAVVPEAVVAWGRCPESAAQAAYWPCIQIGRQLEGADAIDGDLVGDLLPDEGVTPSDDPTADLLALHLSISRVLTSATRPLIVVVDDLQWADPASLRVIEFLASELRSTRTLLVVTIRSSQLDAPGALVDCLGELARQPGAVRVELGGLSGPDVEDWLRGRTDRPADPAVAELLLDRSAGNPCFVGEMVELLAGEDRLSDAAAASRGRLLPAAVGDVVRRRIGRLPGDAQQLLASASVIGRTFDVDVLAAVTGSSLGDVLDGLEPGLVAGIIEATDLPGRFQFSHALVADTLSVELSAIRRARIHAATAIALADLRAGDLDSHLAELAHHAFEGAAAGTAEQAVEWSIRSARAATSQLALEDAAIGWTRALRALELARPRDRVARFDALLELGLAHLGADAVEPAYEAIVAAIDLAIELDDPDRIARAAAAANVEGVWFAGEIGLVSVDMVGALERALAALPAEPTPERALALGALAENCYWKRPVDELDRISGEAVAAARATGDLAILGRTLSKRDQALWWASTLDLRAEATDELLALVEEGSRAADPLPLEVEAVALFGAAGVSWERGDVRAAESAVRRARELAGRIGSPALITQLDFFAATIDTWYGRLAAADERIDVAYELYRRTRRWQADTFRAGFKTMVWVEQGRDDDVRDVGVALLETPYRPWFVEPFAWALTELGDLDAAADLVGGTLPPLDDSWMYLGVLGAAAHVRAALGDRESAAVIRDHLRPYVGRLACVGTGVGLGDVGLAVARLEHLLGDDDEARRLADASVELLARSGPGPWLVRSLLFRADLTGDDGDRARAAQIIDDLDLVLLRRRL